MLKFTASINALILLLLLGPFSNALLAQSSATDEQQQAMQKQQQAIAEQNRAQQALNAGDIQLALNIYQQNAYAGEIWAQLIVGQINQNGKLIPMSLANAVDWYLRAALNGSGIAEYRLSTLFCDESKPAEFRLAKCTDWLKRAMASGVTDAIYDSAVIAHQGKFGLGNYALAKQLATLAKDKGHPQAESLLAKIDQDIEVVNNATLIDSTNVDERLRKSKYTIRLASFTNQFEARRFVVSNADSEIYVYQVGNYTACATDNFRSESAALKAIDKLPETLKAYNPKAIAWQQIKDNLLLTAQPTTTPLAE